MTIVPGRMLPIIVSMTWRTASPLGSDRRTTSARRATSSSDAATSAFSPATASIASGDLSKTTTCARGILRIRLRHIGPPMTPRPMKPTVSSLLESMMVCSSGRVC
jgi:hypothetical protein